MAISDDALEAFDAAATVHSLDSVAHLTHTTRHTIAVYCRLGLITPLDETEHGGWTFDDEAVHQLRRLETLRSTYGLTLPGLRLIATLQAELEELRQELRFHRRRTH